MATLMQRRQFCQGLFALGAIALSGCQATANTGLTVYLLRKSLPPQLIQRFRQQAGVGLQLRLRETPQELANTFAAGILGSAVLSLGDAWIAQAVAQRQIAPIPKPLIQNRWDWAEPWQPLLQLIGEDDALWGLPYRWGATVLIYRRQFFADLGWEPTDWDVLWHPSVQGHYSLLNQPREVIGLTLKSLGLSYNAPPTHPELRQRLQRLRQGCRFFSSDAYLQPLMLGSTQLAVGWSTDVLPLLKRDPQTYAAVFPASGTALWVDLWVCGQNPDAAALAWLNYWWQPEVAEQLSQFSDAPSPLVSDLRRTLLHRYIPLATPTAFAKSELLLPLDVAAQKRYDTLWQEMFLPLS
ncbi:extracellular solute-binding protein [Thermosynechococcus sp. TA-1]|uniref:extracellular solute-binding protein n=1 Tax=Thermosynechococcus sp. TA-1 TaxID=2813673 RepID=UPI00197F6FBC|nr:extracellular solute-binding protein [Thermosynechococcus sp. TA-1]QSF49461.1 extracellular solute-binding protein [Thermosynechococcus sp. TA-1]